VTPPVDQKVVFVGITELPSVTGSPWSGAEVVADLRRVHTESVMYWLAHFRADGFFHRIAPDVWAPVDQVRHLTKSLRAIAKGFEMPRLLLALRFGIAMRRSRDYHTFRQIYEHRLRRGVRNNPFAPRVLEAHEQTEQGRELVMTQHAEAVDRLCRALGRYPEWSLDRLRARHPALGMITMRELAMFALLHNVHHVHVAERRRRETRSAR
jgi:hypothetical protein